MMSIACPNCRRVGTVPNPVPVGTKIRCPGCSTTFKVGIDDATALDLDAVEVGTEVSSYAVAAPASRRSAVAPRADVDLDGDGFDPSRLSPAMATAHLSPKIPDKPWLDFGAPSIVGLAEPWFYRWLERVAGFLWYGAIALLILNGVLIAGFIGFTVHAFGRIPGGARAIIAYLFFAPVLALLPVAVASTLIRLAVDVARNVRGMRFSGG